MKKFVLGIIFFLMALPAFAVCSGQQIGHFVDRNGNLATWVVLDCDGVRPYSNYPAPGTPDRVSCPAEYWDDKGCSAWVIAQSIEQFEGLTPQQASAKIDAEIKTVNETYIKRPYERQAREAEIAERTKRANAIIKDLPAAQPVVTETAVVILPSAPLSKDMMEKTVSTIEVVSEKAYVVAEEIQ